MMSAFFRKNIDKYIRGTREYIFLNYKPVTPSKKSPEINFCLSTHFNRKEEGQNKSVLYSDRDSSSTEQAESNSIDRPQVQLSLKELPKKEDSYDAAEVAQSLRVFASGGDLMKAIRFLEQSINQTFVDKLLYYIKIKGVRDSKVYKAAQVDKRLFSKMVSDREYKPSKDTAIALALALELSLDEANDILSRAGYAFSHSNKRDVIIEYFFREKIYNLIDLNCVLDTFNQKLIGRK